MNKSLIMLLLSFLFCLILSVWMAALWVVAAPLGYGKLIDKAVTDILSGIWDNP